MKGNTANISPIKVQLGNLQDRSAEHYVCFLSFDSESCAFESLPTGYDQSGSPLCLGCSAKKYQIPKLVPTGESSVEYEVHYRSMIIRPGDCVAFEAEADLPLPDHFAPENKPTESIDEQTYPEKYRKNFTRECRSWPSYQTRDLLQCCHIGCVRRIEATSDTILLHTNLFYR